MTQPSLEVEPSRQRLKPLISKRRSISNADFDSHNRLSSSYSAVLSSYQLGDRSIRSSKIGDQDAGLGIRSGQPRFGIDQVWPGYPKTPRSRETIR